MRDSQSVSYTEPSLFLLFLRITVVTSPLHKQSSPSVRFPLLKPLEND
jgi:hypothetical protein